MPTNDIIPLGQEVCAQALEGWVTASLPTGEFGEIRCLILVVFTSMHRVEWDTKSKAEKVFCPVRTG